MDRTTSVPMSVLCHGLDKVRSLDWKPVFPNLVLSSEAANSQDRVKCLLDQIFKESFERSGNQH